MADSIFEPEISRSLRKITNMEDPPLSSIAIECKKETGTSLSFSRVNEDQIEALVNFQIKPYYKKMLVASSVGGMSRFKLKSGFDFMYCNKGKSWVVVNFRATKKASGSKIPKGTNKCFAITIDQLLDVMNTLDRKSIPYEWFTENAVELERISWWDNASRVYGWDLFPLFNWTV